MTEQPAPTADGRRVHIDVPATLESIETLQDAFDRWWSDLGDDAAIATRFSFETAIVEIAANIVEHSRRSDAEVGGRRYTLDLDATDEVLTAEFQDNGLPADIDLAAVTMADVEDESGRGLALALASLERLDYRHEHGRNIWTLVCRR
ncbi:MULTISPECIES: ATP-binding protein [unclassified Curtobacterium]|uniref:ATP-binding protein n=1 Tax=unclassified Curtobacterium TaxID=257496 RepID=UPI000DA79815|nr:MULTISPECIES: ATP-binding protein [unclassified Curtobacterium]PZE24579.1 ATP-binding protein [Curtobacterium sp. MCBD17_028]PZF61214.1 ATP-binding protein [Curtobacterium sp. MCBD17_034]PZM33130.1 ATP-binding protein [Curtobacterium sp. MCBD17_031]